MIEIKVLGPGCARCRQAGKTVREAVDEAGVPVKIEMVHDLLEIAGYGVFGTPAVIVDGEVKYAGKSPKKDEVISWIREKETK